MARRETGKGRGELGSASGEKIRDMPESISGGWSGSPSRGLARTRRAEAIKAVFTAYVQKGDAVIMQEPSYFRFELEGKIRQASITKVPFENDFLMFHFEQNTWFQYLSKLVLHLVCSQFLPEYLNYECDNLLNFHKILLFGKNYSSILHVRHK